MLLQEPKIEFVEIQLGKELVTTSSGTGGGQRCVGSQIDATKCETWDDQTPW